MLVWTLGRVAAQGAVHPRLLRASLCAAMAVPMAVHAAVPGAGSLITTTVAGGSTTIAVAARPAAASVSTTTDVHLQSLAVTADGGAVALVKGNDPTTGLDFYTGSTLAASIHLTPVARSAVARISVNGASVASGAASPAVALAAGQTIVPIVVAAADGSAVARYEARITRPLPVMDLGAGGAGRMDTPATTLLGAGATLTVTAGAAGGAIQPPSDARATVVLGDGGGSVTVERKGFGQAVVLAPAPGQHMPVLGLHPDRTAATGYDPTATLEIASSTPGQVLADVGPVVQGYSAIGRQVVAGPGGARIQLSAVKGTYPVRITVVEGQVTLPCGAPCGGQALTLLPGEMAYVQTDTGLAEAAEAPVPTLPTADTGPLKLWLRPMDMATASPRMQGRSLLQQAEASLQQMLGVPLAARGQAPEGNATWALPDGSVLGILPLGRPRVDLTVPDGAALLPNGLLRIAFNGVATTYAPAPVNLSGVGQAVAAMWPGVELWLEDEAPLVRFDPGASAAVSDPPKVGLWSLGTQTIMRPAWWSTPGGAPGAGFRFETDAQGQRWLLSPEGMRTAVYPALAYFSTTLFATLRQVDPQATLQVLPDARLAARLQGVDYVLVPREQVLYVPKLDGTPDVWFDSEGSKQLIRVRFGSRGMVQTLEMLHTR